MYTVVVEEISMHRLVLYLGTSVVLLCAIRGEAYGSDSLTVEEAVVKALTSSAALQQAEEQRHAAAARITQNESDVYPSVTGSAVYARIGPIPEFALPGFGVLPLAPADNFDAHVTVGETVLDFGRRSASIDVSTSGVQSASDNLMVVRTGITLQTVQTFYGAMLLEQSLLVQDRQIESLQEHLSVTQRRVNSGSATEFDELSTSVRVAEARSKRIDLQRMWDDQMVTLRRLVGLSWDSSVRLVGGFDQRTVSASLDSLVPASENRRADLLVAKDAVESARLQSRLASLGDMPKLKVFASYGVKNGYEPNLNPLRGNWVAGADLEIPIFNGFLTKGKEEEAEAGVHAAEHRLDDLRRIAHAEIRQAYDGMSSAHEKIEISALQVHQAEEAVRNARIRYDSGAGTNLDVLDAETAVATARLQELQSYYQYSLARIQLSAAAGLLSGGYEVLQ